MDKFKRNKDNKTNQNLQTNVSQKQNVRNSTNGGKVSPLRGKISNNNRTEVQLDENTATIHSISAGDKAMLENQFHIALDMGELSPADFPQKSFFSLDGEMKPHMESGDLMAVSFGYDKVQKKVTPIITVIQPDNTENYFEFAVPCPPICGYAAVRELIAEKKEALAEVSV